MRTIPVTRFATVPSVKDSRFLSSRRRPSSDDASCAPDPLPRPHLLRMSAILALFRRHRRTIDRLLGAASVLLPAAVASYAVFLHAGDWPAQRFFIGYTAPLLALGPAWLRRRLASVGEHPNAADRVDLFAFAAGAARSGGGFGVLPYSGHTLFLTYVVLTGPGRGFRAVAVMLLATTTWFKLALWNDPYSWSLGITIGAVLAAVRTYAAARANPLVGTWTTTHVDIDRPHESAN